MEWIARFLAMALTALALQNVVFARALGLNKSLLFLKSPQMGILYGGLLTWMVVCSSIPAALFTALLGGHRVVPFVRAPLFFLCVAAVYMLTWFLSKRYRPALHRQIRGALPLSTFNSALFGVLYIQAGQMYSVLDSVGYALGAGVGYTLALLIIYYARKRLAVSPVPRSFRGLPVLLLYIGLLSLGLYGLLGYGLSL